MFRYSFHTRATQEQAFEAFTDFSDRRLEIWKGTLDPKKYELREQGDSWAVAREGSGGMNVWVELRYEWEAPAVIRWALVDSNHCDRGRWADPDPSREERRRMLRRDGDPPGAAAWAQGARHPGNAEPDRTRAVPAVVETSARPVRRRASQLSRMPGHLAFVRQTPLDQ